MRVVVLVLIVGLAGCGGAEKTPVRMGPRSGAIADGRDAARLSAYGGHLVFSRRAAATGRYTLMHWHAGRLAALGLPARAEPLDADAGPDAHGRPVVVYSAGGRIMELPLDAVRRPRDLGVRGTTPSIWRGRLAYVRGRAVWVGKQRLSTVSGVETLDLGAKAAVFTWHTDNTFGIGEGWNLQLDPLDGGRPKRMVEGYISGACGFVRPLTPTAHGLGAFWVASGATCDRTATDFAESDLATRHPRMARDDGHLIFGATRDATATYWLRSDARVDIPKARSCERTACTIMRAARLRWRTLEPHQRIGPHPG